MDLQELIANVLDQVRSMWRYRWWIVGAAWFVSLPGWLFVYSMPDVFQATAKVFVDTNTLIKPLMRGLTAAENTMNDVEIVAKAVLTRPNLEKVAHETDLVLRAHNQEETARLISDLQSHIHIRGGRDNIFTVEYQDPSRDKARAVVAAVVDKFVEGALGSESNDTDVTAKALRGEIDVHEARLREAEEALAKFKQANLGYMPGEYGDYYQRLQAAETDIAKAQEKIKLVTERRDELKRQIEGEEPVIGIMTGSQFDLGAPCSQSSQIADLESQLASLLVQYTDKYPRVAALKETIGTLKKRCDVEVKEAQATAVPTQPQQPLEANPVYQNLKIQLSDAEVQLVELRTELASGQDEVAKLKRDVDKITEVEAQLKQLNRDYDVIQQRHQELLKRWEDLQATTRLDPVTDKVQFRRIEPPFVRPKPVGPNRPVLLAGVLAAGVGAGLALAFVLSQINPVFFTRKSLARAVELPVLGSISMILTPEAVAKRRRGAVVWSAACLLLVFVAAFAIVFATPGGAIVRTLIGGAGA